MDGPPSREHVNASGKAFLSTARLRGRLILRLVVSGLRVRPADVEAVWSLLCRERQLLGAQTLHMQASRRY